MTDAIGALTTGVVAGALNRWGRTASRVSTALTNCSSFLI
jgi:hypothetical protein